MNPLPLLISLLLLTGCIQKSSQAPTPAPTSPAIVEVIPEEPRISDTLYITYQYTINDYKVKVTWMPLEAGCQNVEGPADIRFTHETGATFTIRHNFYFSDVITFDTTNGRPIFTDQKQFSIKYPNTTIREKIRSDAPFYFADMNYDNKPELVLVNPCKAQRFRDSLTVFAIGDSFKILDSARQITQKEPYCYFDSQTTFDSKDRSVTVNFSGSAGDIEYRKYIYDKRKGYKLSKIYGAENGIEFERDIK